MEDAQLDFESYLIQPFNIKGFYRSFKNKDFTEATPMYSYDLKQINPISPTYATRVKQEKILKAQEEKLKEA